MPIANTVEANIVVNFEDRFSGPACKAFEQFRKCAEAALKALDPAFRDLITRIESGIDKFVNAIDRFALAVDSSVNRLVQKNKEVLTFGKSMESVGKFFRDFWKDLQNLPPAQALGAIVALTVGIATLATLAAKLPPIVGAIATGLLLIFSTWKAIQAFNKLFLEVELKDKATAQSRLLRNSLESVFKDPIVQEIQVLRRNLDGPEGPLSATRNPALDDGFISLQRNAPLSSPFANPLGLNLDPQFEPDPRLSLELRPDRFPSFASGIRFVPRDMLAQIHKGETVLPKAEAEHFRKGSPGGDNITFQITSAFTPNQAIARKFARMIEDERLRINERRSR